MFEKGQQPETMAHPKKVKGRVERREIILNEKVEDVIQTNQVPSSWEKVSGGVYPLKSKK